MCLLVFVTLFTQVTAARLLEKGLPKAVMVPFHCFLPPTILNSVLQTGITRGNEEEQQEFVEKFKGNVWRCLRERDQARPAGVTI